MFAKRIFSLAMISAVMITAGLAVTSQPTEVAGLACQR